MGSSGIKQCIGGTSAPDLLIMMIHVLASLACLGTVGVAQSQAAVVNYTDRSAWTTASGSGVPAISDTFSSGTFARTGYNITGTSGVLGSFPLDPANIPQGPETDVNGTTYFKSFIDNSGGQRQVTFTFSSPIMSLGYDVNPQSSNLGVQIDFLLDGSVTGSFNLPASDVTGFRGFTSSTSFTTFRMTTPTGAAWHGIDNLQAFTTIPEPSETVAIGAVALTAFGMLRRRYSK